jgi:hypothetical protein
VVVRPCLALAAFDLPFILTVEFAWRVALLTAASTVPVWIGKVRMHGMSGHLRLHASLFTAFLFVRGRCSRTIVPRRMRRRLHRETSPDGAAGSGGWASLCARAVHMVLVSDDY